jgi:hypothetical protein
MKKVIFFGLMSIMFNACVTVISDIGPQGNDGNAYFGIDFSYYAPTYYWDNNPSIPNEPFFGEYYRTAPGRYEFEYGVDEDEYWYGYYEVWINRGGHGGSYGERGFDGDDNFLMLVCDPDGFERYRSQVYKSTSEPDSIVFEQNNAEAHYKIVMKKGYR